MEDTSLNKPANKTVLVTDPEAASVLTDFAELRFLLPFIFEELSLTEAARTLGLKLNTLHYRVKRLMDLGLLEVAREEPRKGRAVKLYRATSVNYFVPFEATSSETLETLFAQFRAKMNALFHHNVARSYLEVDGIGLRLKAQGRKLHAEFDTPDGSFLARNMGEPDFPAIFANDGVLRLERSRAKALQRELEALLKTYSSDEQTGQHYLLILGLTPLSTSFLEDE